MKTSLSLLKEANIQPKLRLGNKTKHGIVSTGPHRVKMVADKVILGKDISGKELEYVRYLVEENGQTKTYQTKKLNKEGKYDYIKDT